MQKRRKKGSAVSLRHPLCGQRARGVAEPGREGAPPAAAREKPPAGPAAAARCRKAGDANEVRHRKSPGFKTPMPQLEIATQT